MTYSLIFSDKARKEWNRLDNSLRQQFAKKLEERLENQHVPSARLRHRHNRYKIKARDAGYRLIYDVYDDRIVVVVIAIVRRDGMEVYTTSDDR